jgi:phage terminase large subunit
VTFRGMNEMNSQNIKSLEGYDVAWWEEAQSASRRSFNGSCARPSSASRSELWFSWNPGYPTDPVDEFFRKNPPKNAIVSALNWQDNPWFSPDLKSEIDRDYATNPELAEHVWGGAYEPAPEGNYYGAELQAAESSGRITDIMIDPALPVHTAWDLGVGRNMATWLFQAQMGQFKWVDFVEYDVAGLPYAVTELKKRQQERNFVWGTHLWPHDGSATDTGSGQTRADMMAQLGFSVDVPERPKNVGDGIEAVRRMLATSWFDRDRTAKGLEHLRGYRRKYDKSRERYLDEPDKNGHDHCADAIRTAAQGRDKLTNGMMMAEMPKGVMNWTYPHGA